MAEKTSVLFKSLYVAGVTSPLWVAGLWSLFSSNTDGNQLFIIFANMIAWAVILVGAALWCKPDKVSKKTKLALIAIPIWFASVIMLFFVLVYLGHMTQ